MEKPVKQPSPLVSLIPLVVLVVMLFFTIRIFGADALEGGSQVSLLAASAVSVFIAIVCCNVKWKRIEEAIGTNILGVSVAIIILILIGALSGSWMVSGVVPTLIYYGMKILHPSFFLVSCCAICCLVSLMTGSSWTTVATIGIALMGIGQTQGFSDGWIAGAIISGAYFGDKMSPLSDTTVLASSVTGTPLFTHIRYMMITTVPTILLTLLIFAVAGFLHTSTAADQATIYSALLKEHFYISPWLLLVPVLTGVMIARKWPTLVTLFLSAALAGIFALIFQPHLLQEIAGSPVLDAAARFKGALIMFYGSTQIEMGNEVLNSLVSTRGMGGMMVTIWLILCAMCFGGTMTASGMLQSLTSQMVRFMKRRVSMVTSTVFSGLFMNICTADQYMSIILTCNMYKDIYREKGYESRLLSRTTEDSVTVTSVLVPWNTCGMTQATVLGVATWTYLPYCFFNLISPLMTITMAALGYKITQHHEEDKDLPVR